MRRALVTGGAGFIGSSLADRLLKDGVEVVVYDDYRSGRQEFLESASSQGGCEIVDADTLDTERLTDAMNGCDTVFHLQANADVRHGLSHPLLDNEQNVMATVSVLEAMRASGAGRIAFSSTGSVYGEPALVPTPETCDFPIQTSLYGASKVGAEGVISSYCHAYGFTGAVFRFVSVLGERYTHGHVIDFYRSLRDDPNSLTVLGDGRQRKSYLYIADCIDGMLAGLGATPESDFGVFNLGTDETICVDDSVALITARMGVSPAITHTGGTRGWPGDSPLIHLDCSRLRATGWEPSCSIEEAIVRTVRWLDENSWAVRADTTSVR